MGSLAVSDLYVRSHWHRPLCLQHDHAANCRSCAWNAAGWYSPTVIILFVNKLNNNKLVRTLLWCCMLTRAWIHKAISFQEGWLGSLRVLAVYSSGVVAGALGTSVSEPDTFIAGASGGVYALIAAHLATLILNWKEDSAVKIRKVIHLPLTRIIRLVFISTLVVHDIGLAIYTRFDTEF